MLEVESKISWIECHANWTGPVHGRSVGAVVVGSGDNDPSLGYFACAVAVICFGSNFVPFKFVNTGDGILAQWVMCTGIWIIGILLQLMRSDPVFYPLTLIGGAIWTVGNCCVVPIISLIGLSIGMLIWNCTNVLVGWATGRFGLFGLCPEAPSNEGLNYLGVAISVMAGFVYVFVKTETQVDLPDWIKRRAWRYQMLVEPLEIKEDGGKNPVPALSEVAFLADWPQSWRRNLGIVLSLGSGCLYGAQFLPTIYIQNHVVENGVRASQDGLDYCFSHYCGIYLTSTAVLIGYVISTKKVPQLSRPLVVAGLLSGVLWGIATCSFFLANSMLSPAISFPIIATVPGMIASLWGIFLFREIRGQRNFLILGTAFLLTTTGTLLTASSK